MTLVEITVMKNTNTTEVWYSLFRTKVSVDIIR